MNNLKNSLTFIRELWYAPFIVYLIGFVFVQGAFSPFLSGNLFSQKILTVIPVSYNMYITNGIYQSFVILLPFIISYIHVKYISLPHGLIIRIRRTSRFTQVKIGIFLFSNVGLLVAINKIHLWIIVRDFNIDATLTAFVVFYSYSTLGLFFYKSTAQICKYDLFNKQILILFFTSTLLLLCLLSVYFYGLQSQAQSIKEYRTSDQNIEMISLKYDDGLEKTLVKMDINTEFIIGYDTSTQKMNLIPRDKIKQIETFKSKYPKEIKKYKESLIDNPLAEENKKIIDLINNYYEIRVEINPDIESINTYLSLFTSKLRNNAFESISQDILLNQMKQEKYHDKDYKEYYGIVISEPEEESSSSNSMYKKVYVREYWKAKSYNYEFLVMSTDGVVWNIDDFKETNFSFKAN